MILTKTEKEIMKYIWSINQEVTPKQIREHFVYKNWSKQAISFFLKKLVDIKYLDVRSPSNKEFYYSAIVSEKEYELFCLKNFISDLFGNPFQSKIYCAFSETNKNDTIEELDKLQDKINQIKETIIQDKM